MLRKANECRTFREIEHGSYVATDHTIGFLTTSEDTLTRLWSFTISRLN